MSPTFLRGASGSIGQVCGKRSGNGAAWLNSRPTFWGECLPLARHGASLERKEKLRRQAAKHSLHH